jgi:hypothetical protein
MWIQEGKFNFAEQAHLDKAESKKVSEYCHVCTWALQKSAAADQLSPSPSVMNWTQPESSHSFLAIENREKKDRKVSLLFFFVMNLNVCTSQTRPKLFRNFFLITMY